MWKKLRTALLLVVGLWAVAYVVFWYRRSGCLAAFDLRCNQEIITWLDHVVSLLWVERFQEIIAALIALLAAIVVGRPVYIQLGEMRRQSAAAAIPNFRDIAAEIEEHLAMIEILRPQIIAIVQLLRDYDRENIHWVHRHWPEQAAPVLAALDAFEREIRTATSRHYAVGGEGFGANLTNRLATQLRHLLMVLRLATTGPDFEEGEDELREGEREAARENISATISSWISWSNEYLSQLRERRSAAWRRVRELEDSAIGGTPATPNI